MNSTLCSPAWSRNTPRTMKLQRRSSAGFQFAYSLARGRYPSAVAPLVKDSHKCHSYQSYDTPSGSDSTVVATSAVMAGVPVTLDSKGRVRTFPGTARHHPRRVRAQRLVSAAFARRADLTYSTFAVWVQQHRWRKPPARKASVRLLEAVLTTSTPATVLTVLLPGGRLLARRAYFWSNASKNLVCTFASRWNTTRQSPMGYSSCRTMTFSNGMWDTFHSLR